MYRPMLDKAQLAEFGLRSDDFPAAVIELWPDNVMPKVVFEAMGSQWRIGFAGPTGLDYGALPGVMRMLGVPPEQETDVFDGVRVMESAALRMMNKK
ncbi:DUF1799 domain-containing protein [Bordetella pertussis]|uniref:DUF1799 domain-containing protein n=3 Tax=Bordetella pertussis TaxID=520 RepID=Q7VTY0_BORPE|nr:hypothetical protein BPTD_3322 [Bordetella pertussis CS]AIW93390.1 hypothetical protein B1917_3148 [Bordetella pertussis B1917]AIW94683.1 hypothetical protein B1920_0697 [Bordetella pertussis B1920]AJB25319.1 hypothetical protein Q425_4910 [Bordetella pertussis 137]ALH50441.1 hypothetical protein B1838_3151 [Bordetella pertussis]ETH17761.1 PF08809 family protein [Bordetella pertussis STO1-SEAT-0007]ETH54678.1 PF08809 family protein [Bordetella pertussis I002]ETH58642.1 PF08809 family prot